MTTCRILYLIGELNTGGAERQLCYLLQRMDRDRYRPAVAVWNFSEGDVHVGIIRELRVPIYSFPGKMSSISKLISLRSLLRRLRPEVIHSYSFYTNFAAYWAARRSGAIAMGSIRSDFIWAIKQSGPIRGRLSARWPSSQICNSLAAEQSVRCSRTLFAPHSVSVVRNGIDLVRFSRLALPDEEPFRILGIGYLLPVKRWDRLITAARQLKKQGLKFMVQIAGDGPLRSELERRSVDAGV